MRTTETEDLADALTEAEAFDAKRNRVTITPAADAVRPLPSVLPDPEAPYTVSQVLNNLERFARELAAYPYDCERGPGLVRFIASDILRRGIAREKS